MLSTLSWAFLETFPLLCNTRFIVPLDNPASLAISLIVIFFVVSQGARDLMILLLSNRETKWERIKNYRLTFPAIISN